MALTRFVKWQISDLKCNILLADDDDSVLKQFGDCLGNDPTTITNDDFIEEMSGVSELWLIVIMDGTLSGHDRSVPLSDWLQSRNIESNSENKLIIIGFSGDNRNKTDKCFRWYLKGSTPETAIKKLVELSLKTAKGEIRFDDWPQALPNPVSDVIHSVDNFLIPIRLDADTLQECIKNQKDIKSLRDTLDDIWKDYLGEDATGYLGENSRQHYNTDALTFMYNVIQPSLNANLQGYLDKFIEAVNEVRKFKCSKIYNNASIDRNVPCDECGNNEFIKKVNQLSQDARGLYDNLDSVHKCGIAIIEELRVIRTKEMRAT